MSEKDYCCPERGYWREKINSAWGLASTSVRRAKVGDGEYRYPDGDGTVDISDIAGGGVGSVNGKRGAVELTASDIPTADGRDVESAISSLEDELAGESGTLDSRIATLSTSLESEASTRALNDAEIVSRIGAEESARRSADSALQSQIDDLEAHGATYTAGDGISIEDGVISSTDHAQVSANTSAIAGKQDRLTASQQSAVDSGITGTKVTTYDGYATQIAGKQAKLTASQQSAVDSGITSSKVTTYDGYATQIAGKQTKLSTSQQSAVDSGITSSKVTTYDGYATQISGKQAKLTASQQSAVDSGITSAKVTAYDGYATQIAGKQAKLSTAQQSAVDSGITSSKVSAYDGYSASISSAGALASDAFNDFSITGSVLSMSTAGGRTVSQTLPSSGGGGGGGSANPPAGIEVWRKFNTNAYDGNRFGATTQIVRVVTPIGVVTNRIPVTDGGFRFYGFSTESSKRFVFIEGSFNSAKGIAGFYYSSQSDLDPGDIYMSFPADAVYVLAGYTDGNGGISLEPPQL